MINAMKHAALILLVASAAAGAQTATKPATPSAAKPATHTATTAATTAVKLPPGVPPVKARLQTAFSLRYQDVVIGAGADAAPRKMYSVHYTGWLASTGRKFDSSYDHPGPPLKDKDGKMLRDEKDQIKPGPPQPISFIQGTGRAIPGFDEGFTGMKVGGKRRIFIPWQMAYGELGRDGPDAAHPGIPPKTDLIFDVELLDVKDIAMPANHPAMTTPRPGMSVQPPHPQPTAPAAQPAQSQPAQPAQPQAAQPQPQAQPASAPAAQPAQPQDTQAPPK
jgi:peptidylprolyl isomerase